MPTPAAPQAAAQGQFSVSNVFREMNGPTVAGIPEANPHEPLWWDQHVASAQRDEIPNLGMDLHSLMYLALKYSNQIRIASEDPLIRQTAVQEADANFDWTRYLNTSWNDTNEPVSNSLIAGADATRFQDNIFQAEAGIRRNTRTGGQLDIAQRFGYQDNNSEFFIPGDQATGRLTLAYSQPLLRGRGAVYNQSLVVLAQIDSEVAMDEFRAELQDHLLEVARAYWLLYQERAILAQQVKLYLKTQQIVEVLRERQGIDAQRTQYILASSALATRKSDLIRARTSVVNAETRLRGLINAPELSNSDQVELVPSEFPTLNFVPADLRNEIYTSMQYRPEVHAAIKQVRAGATRLGIAQHELLPVLNLVTEAFVSGLRGDSEFGDAFVDQFSEGGPSYSIGLNYELPVGNRLAKARLCRRQVELRQLERQYSQALEAIQVEVDIAVREMSTSFAEVRARRSALKAAEAEATTIEARWRNLIDGSGNSSLNLESLLDAIERVAAAEGQYVTSLLTLNLASMNLRRSNGTLLQSENVVINQPNNSCAEPLQLDKLGPSNQSQASGQFEQPVYVEQQPVQYQQQPVQYQQQPVQYQQQPVQYQQQPVQYQQQPVQYQQQPVQYQQQPVQYQQQPVQYQQQPVHFQQQPVQRLPSQPLQPQPNPLPAPGQLKSINDIPLIGKAEQSGSGFKWDAPVHGQAKQVSQAKQISQAKQVSFEEQRQVAPQPQQRLQPQPQQRRPQSRKPLPPYRKSFFDESSAPIGRTQNSGDVGNSQR